MSINVNNHPEELITPTHNQLPLTLASIGLILVSMMGIGFLQLPVLNSLQKAHKDYSLATLNKEEAAEKARLQLLQKVPTFGFNNLVADWTFLNFVQYFGDDKARDLVGYEVSPEYFEIIIRQDPRFRDAYLFLSVSSSMYAALPERSVAIMEKGLESISPTVPAKSYYIWRYKGIDELLFLGQPEAAQKSFEKAAEWASVYSDEEGQNVARISKQTAEYLATNPDSKKALVAGWTMVLQNAIDDKTRKIAIQRIEGLGGKIIIAPDGKASIQMPEKD